MKRTAIVLTLGLAALGCESKKTEPKSDPAPAGGSADQPMMAGPSGQPAAHPVGKPLGKPNSQAIAWTKPEAWKDGGQKPMRMATYKIPPAEGDSEEGEVSISRAMGSVDANITRWRGQFKDSPEAKTTDKEIAGIKTTIVEIEGTWTAGSRPMGPPGEPKEGWKMVVAMVHTEGSAHFFKMWGPQKTIESARAAFDEMLGSITKK